MDGSFTPPDGQENENIVGSRAFDAPLHINIAAKLSMYTDILKPNHTHHPSSTITQQG
jgi:hypothetical protein